MVCSMLVAVSTNDIALLNLLHGFFQTMFFKNSVDVVELLLSWTMIELKHIVRVAISTIGTPFIFFILTNFG